MISSLLFDDGWKTEPVANTRKIGLDGQLESDLEQRFLDLLRDWVSVADDVSLDEDGHASGHLRFARGTDLVHWRMTAQQQLRRTRTDFTFNRVDGPSQSVTVYLEGFRFHATPEHNRIASDSQQRTALRAEGHRVFQVTWSDIELFEQRPTSARPVWPPYSGTAQEQAKDAYEEFDGNRAQLTGMVYTNPVNTLIAYLRDPDEQRWASAVGAMVTGLLAEPRTVLLTATTDRRELARTLRAELTGLTADQSEQSPPAGDPVSTLHVFRTHDQSGLPIIVTLDANDPDHPRWTALAALDDRDVALTADGHWQRWRSWLYWTNLTQFLAYAGGDGVQLAYSTAADLDLDTLVVCGGVGELDSLIGPPPPKPPVSVAEPAAATSGPRDQQWDDEILEILDDEPERGGELGVLARRLADRGKRAPVFGYELGTGRWQVDFAWVRPDFKIAVVAMHRDDTDARHRDEAYAKEGWTMRTAAEWLQHLDELEDLLPDMEDSES
jgi:hypothetical protein